MSPQKTRIDRPVVPASSEEPRIVREVAATRRNPLRPIGQAFARRLRFTKAVKAGSRFLAVARKDGPTIALAKAYRKIRRKLNSYRFSMFSTRRCSYFTPRKVREPYEVWQEMNGPNPRRRHRLDGTRTGCPERPLFSVIVPVYNPPIDVFRAMIQSVVDQSFEAWELVLVDDASPDPKVREELERWARQDPRIRAIFRDRNGNISLATNQAAQAATADFLVLLDHDDLLATDALAQVAVHLQENPETDLLYSDDDKVGQDGRRHSEQFKPDWSPELLLSYCYTGHLTVVRSSLFRVVGGMRAGFEGSQDHDFWLRASERAVRIGHVPQVLYHWRVLPGSTAASGDCKPASFEAGRRAVEEAFHRRGLDCRVKQSGWAAKNACAIFEPIMPDHGPSVAILIPTRNHRERLQAAIESLKKTTYGNYRIYIADNESDDPSTLNYLASIPHRVLRIPNANGRFSFAALNNEAVRRVEEDLILFLNDDTEVINPRWLSQMVGWSRLPGVGAVGARLLFPDRRVQHAGIVHGFHSGLAGHAFRLLPEWDPGYLNLARVSRNCFAVTAACMLTPRRLFLEVGGFDESRFAVAYNDADYGYRLVDSGYRCVYCAEAEFFHHEGLSRGFQDDPREVANYREAYGHREDPYFNPHLDRDDEHFRTKPTVVAITREDRPISVLGVTHNLNSEGAPRFEFELLARLKASGAIVPTVLSPCDGQLRVAYEQAGIEIRIDPTLGGVASSPQQYQSILERLSSTIRQDGYEVVHANTLQTFWAVDAARGAGVPSIWSIHESEAWQTYYDELPSENAAAALASMTYPYRVVFTARSTADVWSDLASNRNFDLIHFALEAQRFRTELADIDRHEVRRQLGLRPDDLCVLLVGTICDRKGQQDLPKAFARLPRSLASRMTCVIVGAEGEPEYSQHLRAIVSRLQPDRRDRVRIIHGARETSGYWVSADIYCCTSRIESYPRVVLEAMAAGLPLITTPVFGIKEQVQESVNALLYDPGDSRTLARHLSRLALDETLRRSFAKSSSDVLESLPGTQQMDRRYLETFRAAAESAVPSIESRSETFGSREPRHNSKGTTARPIVHAPSTVGGNPTTFNRARNRATDRQEATG